MSADARLDRGANASTTEAAAVTGWSARLAAFDRPLFLFALLLTVVVLAYFWTPTDPDVWWHLQNGKVVLTTGTVPHGDIYSYTVPGARWIMQQWLLEAGMYALEQTLGYWADVLLFALVTAGVYAILFGLLRASGAGRWAAVAAALGAMVLDAPSWGVRPQIWTTLFFVAYLALLLRYRRRAQVAGPAPPGPRAWLGPDRALWLLPPIMLLWANFHAGFSVGLLLLGAFIAGEIANRLLGWPAAPIRPLIAVTVACAAVSLLNPNGLDLWLYPITYLSGTGGNASLRFVQEWQPPDLRAVRGWPFAAALLILLALNLVRRPAAGPPEGAAAARPARSGTWGDASLIFTLAGFTMMGFQALRFLPLFGIVWAVVVARRAAELWPALAAPDARTAPVPDSGALLRGRLNLGLYAVVAVLLAAFMLTAPRAQVHAQPLTTAYPVAAVDYLDAHRATLPQPVHLFHDYGWGGYLIARGWPVFVDGRADPYNALLDDYVAASAGVRWQAVFAQYGVNAVLITPGTGLDAALRADSAWTRVYGDPGAVLYLHR